LTALHCVLAGKRIYSEIFTDITMANLFFNCWNRDSYCHLMQVFLQ